MRTNIDIDIKNDTFSVTIEHIPLSLIPSMANLPQMVADSLAHVVTMLYGDPDFGRAVAAHAMEGKLRNGDIGKGPAPKPSHQTGTDRNGIQYI